MPKEKYDHIQIIDERPSKKGSGSLMLISAGIGAVICFVLFLMFL